MPKVMSQFDLRGNAVKNFRVEELTDAPAAPTKGRTYFSSVLNCLVIWNDTAWIPLDAAKRMGDIPLSALATDPLARANHTGTQLAATISDFAAAVRGTNAFPDHQPDR